MKINGWFVGVIIILLILWYMAVPQNEHFEGLTQKINVRLDENGNVISYNWKFPRMNGKLGCAIVPCPDKFDDSFVCWSCCNYF